MTAISRPLHIGRPLVRVESTTSTMDLLRDLAALGAVPGTAVVAGHQSQGRGRSNRRWETPPRTAVLLSFLTSSGRPPAALGLLSMVWALAVAETVEQFSSSIPQIKWPNDVLVNGKKISGILIVNAKLPGYQDYSQVTGIGLNCLAGPSDLPPGATSLQVESEQAIHYDEVLKALLDRLSGVFATFEAGRTEQLMAALHDRLTFHGEMVQIRDGDRMIEGRVNGLLPGGALALELSTGEVVPVVAGELTRGPRPAG